MRLSKSDWASEIAWLVGAKKVKLELVSFSLETRFGRYCSLSSTRSVPLEFETSTSGMGPGIVRTLGMTFSSKFWTVVLDNTVAFWPMRPVVPFSSL